MSLGFEFNILIVDDERGNLDMLNRILGQDYEVSVAKSGKAALKRAMEDKPDLILLDVVMQDMTGFDVLTALKKSELTSKIPVIFITGLSSVEGEEKGLSLGAVDYITKPFNASIVKARVKTHLQIVKHLRIIEQMGMIDPLTNLPNRRCYEERLLMEWARAMREHIPLSLMLLDIDNFKVINDTLGHPLGDAILISSGGVFASALRRQTDFAARLGGDEFAVILPHTMTVGAVEVAETIRSGIAHINVANLPGAQDLLLDALSPAQLPPVTVSIGVAGGIPEPNESAQDLIKRADVWLYQAKNQGRNRVCS